MTMVTGVTPKGAARKGATGMVTRGHDRRPAELTAAEQPLTVGRPEAAPRHRVQPTGRRVFRTADTNMLGAHSQPSSIG